MPEWEPSNRAFTEVGEPHDSVAVGIGQHLASCPVLVTAGLDAKSIAMGQDPPGATLRWWQPATADAPDL